MGVYLDRHEEPPLLLCSQKKNNYKIRLICDIVHFYYTLEKNKKTSALSSRVCGQPGILKRTTVHSTTRTQRSLDYRVRKPLKWMPSRTTWRAVDSQLGYPKHRCGSIPQLNIVALYSGISKGEICMGAWTIIAEHGVLDVIFDTSKKWDKVFFL